MKSLLAFLINLIFLPIVWIMVACSNEKKDSK